MLRATPIRILNHQPNPPSYSRLQLVDSASHPLPPPRLYIQVELMDDRKWKVLASASQLARQEMTLLQDAHLVNVGAVYGVAALSPDPGPPSGLFWLRNPTATRQEATFNVGNLLEVPEALQNAHWSFVPVEPPEGCEAASKGMTFQEEEVTIILQPFELQLWRVETK